MSRTRLRRPAAVLAMLSLLVASPPPALGCGPYSLDAVFTLAERPDSGADYLAGRLGVVLPGYRTPYLYVAYRHFAGNPLPRAEQESLHWWRTPSAKSPIEDGVSLWLRASRPEEVSSARNRARNRINTARVVPGSDYEFYDNCQDDAFRSAAATLERRIALAGRSSAAVGDWLRAQQAVFSNCSAGSAVPEPAPPDSPEWLRMDRAYQVAAAHFYGERLDEAEKEFRAIGSDPASPWSALAPYLATRCLVRQATLLSPPETVDAVKLGRAEEELRRIVRDGKSPSLRRAAERLLGFVSFRLHPAQRLEELARRLVSSASTADLSQDLTDYTLLLERVPEATTESDLSGWLRNIQGAFWAESLDVERLRNIQDVRAKFLGVALRHWNERPSIPWLVAVLLQLPPQHAQAVDLLEAAAKVDRGSPAWTTVAFHRARLLAGRGEAKAARDLLDSALSNREPLPTSSANLFLTQRLRLARTFEEFLRDSPRLPAQFGRWNEGESKIDSAAVGQRLFDDDAAQTFNKALPLGLWNQAARSLLLPENLRRNLRLAAWTRAALLGYEEVAGELAPMLALDLPEVAGLFEAYRASPAGPPRRFAAVFTLLRLPGARPSVHRGPLREAPAPEIDNLRENWWCPGGAVSDYWTFAVSRSKEGLPARGPRIEPSTGFLTEAEQRQGVREAEEAERLDSAPNLLAREVLTWAKSHPDDPRVPEALHESVRATRYGCTDQASGALSREAFETLHRRYPASPWTKKTPYWFR